MILNENHRQAFLDELDKLNEKLATQKKVIESRVAEDDKSGKDIGFIQYCEAHVFMLEERIRVVKKALIENEMDY